MSSSTQDLYRHSLVDFKPKGDKLVFAIISPYSFESLSTRYIGSAVRNAGYECLEIYYEDLKRNFFKYPEPEELKKLIDILRKNNVDIVGLSVRSSYRKLAEIFTRQIQNDLDIPVIWGATHPTVCPDDSIKVADAICRGEGEIPLVKFLDSISEGKDITKTEGFWIKMPDGSIVKNGMAPYADLSTLSDPDHTAGNKYYSVDGKWSEGDPQLYESTYITMTSRGCPYKCSYCSNTFFLNANPNYLRYRSVDAVINEFKHVMKVMPNIRRIKFYDDLFATNKKWTDEFVVKYKKEINLPFLAQLNPQHVTKTLITKLKKAGLDLVDMGIQTGSERLANEVYDRRITNEKLMSAVNVLHEFGMRSIFHLIADNPLETSEDKRASFEFLFQIPRPFSLSIYSLTHFPGTPLTEKLLKEGVIKESELEGNSDHSLFQFEVSLTLPRPAEDRFWLALISLLTKDFVPKSWIWTLSKSKLLMRHPSPLILFAWLMNFTKLTLYALKMYRDGYLSIQMIRRYMNLRSLSIK